MSASLEALIPELQEPAKALVQLGGRAGVQPRVTSTVRTASQQKRLYAAFLRGETHYPVAPPGTSSHEFGYAFDMVAASQTDLHDLGAVWVSWGGKWSSEDEVHFEYPGFNPRTAAPAGPPQCSTFAKLFLGAVDLAGGFLPVVGEVEFVAWLASLGFPDSEILKFLQNPVTYLAGC